MATSHLPMPLLETLITGIGSAIAGTTLKLWLKDAPLAESVGSTVSDILIKKIPDLLKRNAVQRTFDSIRDEAAASVLKLLEKEACDVDSRRLGIVANAASATLEATTIDAKILVSYNLCADELVEYFKGRTGQEGGNPALAGKESGFQKFTTVEQDVYSRILSHASQLIVDMASSFPHFEERLNAEILQRLESMAYQVIEGMNRVVSEQSDAFEADYRNSCVRKFDQLELFGIDLHESNQRYNLSIAYVTLMVEKLGNSGSTLTENDDAERDGLSAENALAAHNRLFVRGTAGSGKTTLLQWFAVFAAARRLPEGLAAFNDYVPFLIKLRNFSNGDLPTPEMFPIEAAKHLAGKMPQGWVHQRLESGRALVLIDGLDEAAESQRKSVRKWLRELIGSFPNARYVVTTRPHAAEEGWLDADDFIDAELQDMALTDVDEFIEHWHDAVAESIRDVTEKQQLPNLATQLKSKIRNKPEILRLAVSPLLCALLCALHRQRVSNLPSDRIELYKACIEMFFRRDEERAITAVDYVSLSDRQKETLLQDFAWWMIRNGLTTATPEEAKNRFAKGLIRLRGEKSSMTNGDDILKLFLQRIGIIRMLAHQKIDFPHRTFQEYLAARCAIEEDDLGMLVDNAHDDQWREVVILASGLLSPIRSERLIRNLLTKGDGDPERRHELYMVAVSALDMVVAPPEASDIDQEVSQRLKSIVPPNSIGDAKELVAAGDLVVPHLKYRKNLKISQAAASIRTLALIGTELAFDCLEEYRSDSRASVLVQFEYSLRFVPNLQAYLERFGDLIHKLNFTYRSVPDLNLLKLCPNLVSLDLWGTRVMDITPLVSLRNLTSLNLGSTRVRNIEPLANCPWLRSLGLLHTGITKDQIDKLRARLPDLLVSTTLH
jgi:hypothetical protein